MVSKWLAFLAILSWTLGFIAMVKSNYIGFLPMCIGIGAWNWNLEPRGAGWVGYSVKAGAVVGVCLGVYAVLS